MSCILFLLLSIAIDHHRPKREIGEKLVHQLSYPQSANVSYQSHEFPCSLVKAPCSDAFSMACPSFPNKIPAPFFLYGFPMVFLWSSYGFPMVFRFSHGFPMVFLPLPLLSPDPRHLWGSRLVSMTWGRGAIAAV